MQVRGKKMQAQLNKILEQAREQLVKAETMAQTDEIRVKLLGKRDSLQRS